MNAEVVRSDVGVWMTCDDPTVSVSRAIAIEAMQALGLDPNDWRQRDRVIAAISERVNATLDGIAKIESVDNTQAISKELKIVDAVRRCVRVFREAEPETVEKELIRFLDSLRVAGLSAWDNVPDPEALIGDDDE